MRFDLKTKDGLRNACREAERHLDQESIARNADFLEKVSKTPEVERDKEEFLRLVWDENPLADLGNGDYSVQEALADPDFRRQFLELIKSPLASQNEERSARVEEIYRETLDLVQRYVPPNKNESRHRPWIKTARTLAALLPDDSTTLIRKEERNELRDYMGVGEQYRGSFGQGNRLIIDRLNDAIGQVDPLKWHDRSQRLELPRKLLELAAQVVDNPSALPGPSLNLISESLKSIQEEEGLIFDGGLIESLHLGLWAHERRRFGVLTGLSGTGKTQLALKYAEALTGATGESNEQVCTIPVQPGWYDPTPLLGYVNPLGEGRYIQTEFLRFLIRASENLTEPHVCVLDEMNLSHPEQYLAPILSAMEREDGDIPLHGGDGHEYGVPPSIRYPGNFVLIGTVNMDETTMGISDKVLDRAFTLEFWDIDLYRWPGWDKCKIEASDRTDVREVLNDLMDALRPARLHFGWRVIAEVAQFMELRQEQSAELSTRDALDRVIYAKVLPKLRGDDSRRVRDALEKCEKVLKEHSLTRCAEKVAELAQDLKETGSFRFWR